MPFLPRKKGQKKKIKKGPETEPKERKKEKGRRCSQVLPGAITRSPSCEWNPQSWRIPQNKIGFSE